MSVQAAEDLPAGRWVPNAGRSGPVGMGLMGNAATNGNKAGGVPGALILVFPGRLPVA